MVGARQTSLDDVDADVVEAGVELLLQELGRDLVDGVDALGVLGRQGGRGCHGIAAVGGDDLLVRLETPVYEGI